MAHTADYFRARRRAQGVPERDGFDHPRFVAQGRQLHWLFDAPLHDLPWPRNLFCNNATIEKLMADGDFSALKIGKPPGPTEVREPNLPHTAQPRGRSGHRGSRQPRRPLVLHDEVPEHALGLGA